MENDSRSKMKFSAATWIAVLTFTILSCANPAGGGSDPDPKPVPGGEGILTVTGYDPSSVSFSWHAASDTETAVDLLEYRLFYASVDVFSDAAAAETSGTASGDWQAGLLSGAVGGLSASTGYHFTVLVRDSDGNRSMYRSIFQVTADAPAGDPPIHAPSSIGFTDTDAEWGHVGGTVTIGRATDESDISHYLLYWGSGSSEKLDGAEALANIAASGSDLAFDIPSDTPIPTGATYLLAFTRNANGESATCAFVFLSDLGNRSGLTSLNLSVGTLNPAFEASTLVYSASVGLSQETISLSPAAEDPAAIILVDGSPVPSGGISGAIPLGFGPTAISVHVTSPDGSAERTYTVTVTRGMSMQEAYIKASNTGSNDYFGYSVAIDGDTLAVGAFMEASSATGVDGNQTDNSANGAGAVYVFTRSGSAWSQQAYLKASNTGSNDAFGYSLAIDGDTLVVGAPGEASSATGVNGNQADNSNNGAGAVFIFTRSGSVWSQQAYLKASNTGSSDAFGHSLAIDGDVLVVGAPGEASSASGVNGNQLNNSLANSGAAYVFVRSGSVWSQQAYLKASNTGGGDRFGQSVTIYVDTVVIGAPYEASSATGINGNQASNTATAAGAAYVFTRSGSIWSQQAYLKASNTALGDIFGGSVAIDGDTLLVGAPDEDSSSTGINGNQGDNSAVNSGAAYIFVRTGSVWSQQAYLKSSNTEANDNFGRSVAIDGDTAVIGAPYENSAAIGVNGDQADNSADNAGAVYLFVRVDSAWKQCSYLKAMNPEENDRFGWSVTISQVTAGIGAYFEDSVATGVDGDASDNSASASGAIFVFR